jgi:hypothetical protein
MCVCGRHVRPCHAYQSPRPIVCLGATRLACYQSRHATSTVHQAPPFYCPINLTKLLSPCPVFFARRPNDIISVGIPLAFLSQTPTILFVTGGKNDMGFSLEGAGHGHWADPSDDHPPHFLALPAIHSFTGFCYSSILDMPSAASVGICCISARSYRAGPPLISTGCQFKNQ